MKTPSTRPWTRLAFALLVLAGLAVGAATSWAANITYYSQGSLDPGLVASWNTIRTGGGITPSNFTSGDVFVIQNGHNMAVSSPGWSLNGTGSELWIESGGTLTANYAVILNSPTTFRIDGGGTYVHNNSTAYGTSIFQAGTKSFAATSTVILNNSNGTGPTGVTFGNLVVNLLAPPGSVQCNGGVTTINGNLTIESTSTYQFRLSANTDYTLTIGGNLVLHSGTFVLSNGTAAGLTYRVNLGGNFNQTGGTFASNNASSPATLAFSGGAATATFASRPGTFYSNYLNLQIASGKTVTVVDTMSSSVLLCGSGRTIAIDGTLQVTAGSSPVLAGTATVGGTGSIQVDAGCSLYLGSGDGSVAGTLNNGGATTIDGTLRINPGSAFTGIAPLYGGGSTLYYARTGAIGSEWGPGDTAGPGVPQNVQLKFSSPGGSLALAGDRAVPGVLSFVSPGGIVATASHVLTVGGTLGAPTFGWVNGRLRRQVTGTGTRVFDLGDATNSLPVTVVTTTLASPGGLTIGMTAGAHPDLASSAIDPVKYVGRYWTTTGGGLSGTHNVTFTFLPGDVQGSADYNRYIAGVFDAGWSYPSVGSKSPTSFQAMGLSTYGDVAIGEQSAWTITASSTPGGSISPFGSVTVSPGADQSFNAVAGSGYHLEDLVVDRVSQGATGSYTFTSVAANHTIRAHFVSDTAPPDLIASWAMDEGTGNVAHDGSGHGNDGALVNGASWPVRAGGTAIGLDGVAQYASVPPNTTLDCTSALTLAAWIRPDVTRAQNVITKAVAGGTDGYELGLSGDGHPFFRLNQPALTPRLDANATYPAGGGAWMHVAATFDGTYVRIFINGLEDNASTVPTTLTILTNSLPLAIGAQVDATGLASRFFQGAIDDARVYGRALGANEIRMLAGLATYRITASAGTGGSISPAGTAYVVPGGSQAFTIAAAPGYAIADVLADGTSVGPVATYTFVDVAADHTIAASFTLRNSPPGAPTVIAPPNDATGVSPSPSLDVAVSDPDGSALSVTYYARAAAQMLPAADFSVIVLPDAQNYTGSVNGGSPAVLTRQTQWIVDTRSARNTAYVAQVGDLSENGDRYEVEWQAADTAFRLIEDPLTTGMPEGLPYGIAVGNHDQIPYGATTFYNQYFGVSRFASRSYYGGHYGVNNNNHYDLFSASGMEFLVIYLELNDSPGAAVLNWADGLLKSHPSRRGIVVSHHLIEPPDPSTWGAQGLAIYDALKGNPNLFLMLCGHMTTEGTRTDTYNGSTISTLLADYQDRDNGGDGWLRILQFSPTSDEIHVMTYSPWLDTWETDASSQFTLAYDMPATTHASFTAIGTVTGVASGTTCRLSWPGRSATTAYEWYATVSDGEFSTVGPTCTFTTGSGVAPAPVPDLSAAPVRAGGGASAGIQLTWTATPSGTHVEVWRACFGHYPAYRRAGGKAPTAPVVWSDPPAVGWSVVGDVASPEATFTDRVAERDCYHYVAFEKDADGTPSAGSAMTGGTLSYLLGDVSDGTTACAGDDVVGTADISLLGTNYGMTMTTPTDPLACLDVGPTVDGAPSSRPEPDGQVEFEDLVLFALNYTGGTGASQAPVAARRTGAAANPPDPAGALAMTAPALPGVGEVFDATIEACGVTNVRAMKLRLVYDLAVLERVGVFAGELLTRPGAPSLVLTPEPARVDVAVLGGDAGLNGSGEMVRVRFRVKRAGDPQLALASAEARGNANQKVMLAMSGTSGVLTPPSTTSLSAARPNPFVGSTTLGVALAVGGPVELAIYGVDGRRFATLVKEARVPGRYQFTWDGRDRNGRAAQPGVYYARLSTPQGRFTRALVLMK